MNQRLLPITLIVGVTSLAHAAFNPVPITPDSYTADIVIEKGAPPPLGNFCTVTIDQGTNNYQNTFYEMGYVTALPWTGLPHPGSVFTSQNDPNHTFKMPPSYATNNVAFIGAKNIPGSNPAVLQTQVASASLTINNPTPTANLSILYASGGNGTNINLTLYHDDGTSETATFNSVDWFNAAAATYIARGRIAMDGSSPLNTLNSTTQTKLFNADIPLANTTSAVTNVVFGYSGGDFRLFVFGLSQSADAVTYSPLTVSGFNADAVIEVGAPPPAMVQGTTVTMDSAGTNNTGTTYFEQGFDRFAPTVGLPHPGGTITNGNHLFQMPSTYVGNDCLYIGNFGADGLHPDYHTGTLTLGTPGAFTALSVLTSAGNGPVSINYTVHYSDGNTKTGNFSALDWFAGGSAAFVANGRVQVENNGLNNIGGGACKLWQNDITVDNTKTVTSIDFSYVSGGRAPIFALSGQTATGGNFNPLAISGFNADIVVEAAQPIWPGGLFTATTATMDNGTNNYAFTWSEQGWQTNGTPAGVGLPAAGSLLASLQDANRKYQLPASYTAPNAVLIDTNHQVANITPTSPAAYTSISLLTAGASIGGANVMTNLCILQHADGTSETNAFYGYDWFNGTVAPAFIANGRGDTRYRTIGNIAGGFPRMFETQFALNNTTSPITNIQVQYKLAGGANWTTYVMAVSGSTDPVAPIFAFPTPNITTFEGSNIVMSVPVTGTPPFTYQWQESQDGTNWVNLTDTSVIAGSTTTTLSFTPVGWTNAAQYRLVAFNVTGSATNSPGTLTVMLSSPNVTSPSDTISAYQPNGGSSPAAEAVTYAIDHTTSKYLNFGVNGGAPFVGPVGFIVTPSIGKTTLAGLRFYTANDAVERDPADYTLEGSNDGGATWTTLGSSALNLPTGRNAAGTAYSPLTNFMQEVHFTNSTGYVTYRLSINSVRTPSTANSMQIGEVEMLGVPTPSAPVIVQQPPASLKVFAGTSPSLTVVATGYPTNLAYQWYLGSSAISGATTATYTLNNVQVSDSGKSFSVTVANSQGTITSASSTLQVIAAPTQSYPTAILAANPTAYWRLDEPDNGLGNSGVVANDYAGGHSGVYSNVILQVNGYNPAIDSDKAAQFGGFLVADVVPTDNYVVARNVTFASPTNVPATFSVEAWVYGTSANQVNGAGLVANGYGGGGEQFALDCGGPGTAVRFFFRDAAGAAHNASSTLALNDSKWHHVVGVLDEAHTNQVIYVDGLAAATNGLAANLGVMKATTALSIGARQQSATTNFNLQFIGTIDEVALYNTALSPSQVLNHYYAADPAPAFTLQPTNTTAPEGSTAVLYSSAYGPGTVSYQWYQSADGATFSPLSGKTSASLSLANVPTSVNGYFYQVVAANSYGSVTSAVAQLTIVSGPPQIDPLPAQALVYAGRPISLAANVGGTAPFTYQWQLNGANLNDNARISGSHSNVLTILDTQSSDAGNYQLIANNAQGSTPSTLEAVLVQGRPQLNTNGFGWGLNGNPSAATVDNGVLSLTTGTGSSARSAFYPFPLYIGNFYATYTYQDVNGGGADGVAFVLQNDPRGASALGGAGGGLGVSGITPSAELEFNIYSSGTTIFPGLAYHVNGATGGYNDTAPINVANGDLINVTVRYSQGVALVTLTDPSLGESYSTSLAVGDLPTQLGADTAYVGFTGADGGTASVQNVSNFTFTPFPTMKVSPAGANVVISWPAEIGGFVLQTKPSLTAGSWSNVAAPVNLVGGSNQVVVPASSLGFYRLTLP